MHLRDSSFNRIRVLESRQASLLEGNAGRWTRAGDALDVQRGERLVCMHEAEGDELLGYHFEEGQLYDHRRC